MSLNTLYRNPESVAAIAGQFCKEADEQEIPWCDVFDGDEIGPYHGSYSTYPEAYSERFSYYIRDAVSLRVDNYWWHEHFGCCDICGSQLLCVGRYFYASPSGFSYWRNNNRCQDKACQKVHDFFYRKTQDGSGYLLEVAKNRSLLKSKTGYGTKQIDKMDTGLKFPILLTAMMEMLK